jgi:hypothetical protein
MSVNGWMKNPIWSPKWTLFFFAILGGFFVVFGIIFLSAADLTTEVAVDYRMGGTCSDDISKTDGAVSTEQDSCEDSVLHSNANMMEGFQFKVPADMAKPIHMYVEIDGFYQNHRRWVRSVSNNAPNVIQRGGNIFDYHEEQDGYVANDGQDYQSAIYRFWHPAHVQGMRGGCFPWYAEGDVEDCVSEINPALNPCKKGPDTGNRVFYPCGLGARAHFNDTFAVSKGATTQTEVVLDETHESITYTNDYVNRFNNLDPEATFHCDAKKKCLDMPGDNKADCESEAARGHMADTIAKMKDQDCKKQDGLEFQQVVNMHLLRDYPPALCADDPLRLAQFDVKEQDNNDNKVYNPDCTKYNKFSYTASKNEATCNYATMIAESDAAKKPKNPFTGAAVACSSQIPNPSGWGLENSHYINWVRLSGTTNFRKLYAVIDEEWKADDVINLFVANRFDFKTIGGKDSTHTKRVIFTTASTVGGKHEYIGLTFLISGVVCLTFFLFVLMQHMKDPRRVDKIDFMEWADNRKAVKPKDE